MKKLYISICVLSLSLFTQVYASPAINCGALPGCESTGSGVSTGVYMIIGNLIGTLIEYVSVIAVLAVMIGGIMYLISGGDEEKTKKAKNIIIWALLGVLVSVFAWSLINIINRFTI